jgi:hypothetical protein
MTLCGVLKNILLVLTSVLLWGTVIMPLQVLGYIIALAGLIYYGIGYEGIQTSYCYTSKYAQQLWEGEKMFETATTGNRGAVFRKVAIVCVFTFCVIGLVAGMTVRSGQAEEFVQGLRKGFD